MSVFCSKRKMEAITKNHLKLFLYLNFLNVFLDKLLEIASSDKNRNMHAFFKKFFKIVLHPFKTFFWV